MAFFSKCLLGSWVIFMMADNKEQRVCVKFCFLLGQSAGETVLMPTLCHATFFCSLVWKARWKWNVLLTSAKWKRICWRSRSTSALKSSRNVFGSAKNVGTSVLSQKESTLKETRFVIVQNLINHLKKNNSCYFWVPPSYIRRESNSQWKKTCRYSR